MAECSCESFEGSLLRICERKKYLLLAIKKCHVCPVLSESFMGTGAKTAAGAGRGAQKDALGDLGTALPVPYSENESGMGNRLKH